MAGLCCARCENIIKSFLNEWQLKYDHVCEINDGPKSDFQNEAKCKTFLVKMSFICMRIIKKHLHINGFARSLALKKRLEATGKWLIVKSSKPLIKNLLWQMSPGAICCPYIGKCANVIIESIAAFP